MKLRVLTIPFDVEERSFNDEQLQQVLSETNVVSYASHFFIHDGLPGMALVIATAEATPSMPRTMRRSSPIEIPQSDQVLFEALRKWRNDRSTRSGKPPYVIFTNQQLAAIAKTRPVNRTELDAISGVGGGRIDEYAEELLQVVAKIPSPVTPATNTSTHPNG